jgi:hypothetical protein
MPKGDLIEAVSSILSDRDRATLERAAELGALHTADQVRGWAGAASYDVASTLSAYAEALGAAQALIGDLIALVRRLGKDEAHTCATCGAWVGIFTGHGGGWHHYRGEGTAESPVGIYDAGHQATPRRPGGCGE